MIPIEAILFDLDGTLIDSKRDLALAVRYLQRSLGREPSSEEQVGSFIGDGVLKLVQRALPDLKGDALLDAVERFKRYYRVHCLDHTRAYPSVTLALQQFRNKRLAVVTNKPERISRRILDSLGLLSRFSIVLGGDSVRHKKPHPAPVRHALRAMGIASPRAAVVVGDGVNDILAGRAAGTWTCGVLSNIGDPVKLRKTRPDFLIHRLGELCGLFA